MSAPLKVVFVSALLSCAAFFSGSAQAKSGEVLCAQMVERSYFLPAADCYIKEAGKIPYRADIKEEDRIRKGGFLREAARNLDRAAGAEKRPQVAAALREKAVALLDRVLKLQLVRRKAGKRRGRLFKLMRGKIYAKIGYTPLAISTASLTARIEVKGFQFKAATQNKFNRSLRPGPYTVRVKYTNESVWRTKAIVLKAGVPAVLSFVKRPPIPALTWVGYTVGSAAIIAGVVMLGYGISYFSAAGSCQNPAECRFVKLINGTYSTCFKDGLRGCLSGFPLRNLVRREGMEHYNEQGTFWSVLGGSTAGLGVALFSVALVVHTRSQSADQAQKKKATTALPTKRMAPVPARQQAALGGRQTLLTNPL